MIFYYDDYRNIGQENNYFFYKIAFTFFIKRQKYFLFKVYELNFVILLRNRLWTFNNKKLYSGGYWYSQNFKKNIDPIVIDSLAGLKKYY